MPTFFALELPSRLHLHQHSYIITIVEFQNCTLQQKFMSEASESAKSFAVNDFPKAFRNKCTPTIRLENIHHGYMAILTDGMAHFVIKHIGQYESTLLHWYDIVVRVAGAGQSQAFDEIGNVIWAKTVSHGDCLSQNGYRQIYTNINIYNDTYICLHVCASGCEQLG